MIKCVIGDGAVASLDYEIPFYSLQKPGMIPCRVSQCLCNSKSLWSIGIDWYHLRDTFDHNFEDVSIEVNRGGKILFECAHYHPVGLGAI